jgi:beta-lactamase regulating signal transducer with metallopeptidase domain/protocatechuate 3,4-dioxygenase beta subunit
MLSNLVELANSFGDRWAAWMAAALLDSVALLAVIGLVWFAIRRRVAPQVGYCLFLLVPLRLLSPVEIAVPPSVAHWTPSKLLASLFSRTDRIASDNSGPSAAESVFSQDQAGRDPSEPRSPRLADRPRVAREFGAAGPASRATTPAVTDLPAAAEMTVRWPAIGMVAWFVAVLLLAVRFTWMQLGFRERLRAASPVDESRLAVDFRELCARAGVSRTVRLVESDRVMAPAVWGLLRPTIILPRGIASSLTAKQLRWVLLHELAHVRRRDLLVIVVQRFAAILNFYNPAVWIANRIANRLREYACDDFAILLSEGSGVESGEAFVQVLRNEQRAHRKLEGALGMFGLDSRAACVHRVRRMLDLERPLRTRPGWLSLTGLILLAAVALPHLRAATSNDNSVSQVAADDSAKPLAASDAEPQPKPPVAKSEAKETVPFTLTGHAKGPDGKPVVGATINLCMGPNQNSSVAATTISGGDGRYEFKAIRLPVSPASGSRERLLSGGFSLYGTATGYGFAWSGSRDFWDKDKPSDAGIVPGDWRTRPGHVDFYRNEPTVVDLDFTTAASLKGRVVDEDNQPIAGVEVSLWHSDYLNGEGKALHINYREFYGMRQLLKRDQLVANTDKDGRFEIGGLPAEVCFGVSAEHPRFGNTSFHAATTNRPITVHHFDRSAVTIQGNMQVEISNLDSHEVRTGDLTILLHPVRNVLIDVIEQDTGRPAANVEVGTNTLLGNGPSAYAKTNREGRVVLKLPMGQYRLTADPPRDSLYVRTRAKLDGTAGRDKEPFTLQLIKGCVVNFETTDAETGQAIEGIGFQAKDMTGGAPNLESHRGGSQLVQSSTVYVDNPRTDKNGRMRAVMPPGNYKFSAVGQWRGSRNLSDEYESAFASLPTHLASDETVAVKFQLKRKSPPADEAPKAPTGGGGNAGKTPATPAAKPDANAAPKDEQTFELTVVGPDRKPLPGIVVECRGRPDLKAEQMQSGEFVRKASYGLLIKLNANGKLVLKLPKDMKSFDVFIETTGYAPYWAGWNSESYPQPIPSTLTAELDAAWSAGGIVVDDDGKPVKGVTLRPSIEFKKRPGIASQMGIGTSPKTDSEGKWHFDSVPASMADVAVEINHPNYMPVWRTLTRAEFGIERGAAPVAKIILKPGLTVTGKVTDESGKPIAGARIRGKFLNDIREATTGDGGIYRLTGCDRITARIVVSAKGRATDMQELRVEPDMKPVDFQMKLGGTVRIRVVDAHDQPVPRARIFLQWWRGPFQYFEFDQKSDYADEHGVWVWKEAPLDEFKADICPGNGDGMNLTRQSLIARKEEYVFKLPDALVISGKVSDAETKKPIEKFLVVPGRIENVSSQSFLGWDREERLAVTDGQYRIRRTYNYYAHFVRIEADGYQAAVSREIKSDEGNVSIDFELKRAKNIVATLLTPQGAPAAKAKIALGIVGSQINVTNGDIADSQTYAARQTTDEAGRFDFPPQDGPFQLVITHPTGFAHVKLNASPEKPTTLYLEPWARVEGTFRVGKTPAPNVPITINSNVYDEHGDGVPHIFSQHEATTGSDGRFVFERVIPGDGQIGRYIMLTVNDGAAAVTSTCMTNTSFRSGRTLRIDLGGTGRIVAGRLQPPEGIKDRIPWNFAVVTAETDWYPLPRYMATVDRDGAFRIDDMLAGEYTLGVSFSQRDVGSLSNYRFTVPAKPSDQPLDLGVLKLK